MKIQLEKPIAFFPQLSKILGGIEEAVYFQQLYYWKDRGCREDGYIYKTKKEIEEETTLTRYQQDRIRTKLKSMGILEEKLIKANGSPTIHYKLNIEAVQNLLMEKQETYYSNSKKLTIPLTENTTENTIHNNIHIVGKANEWVFASKLKEMKEANRKDLQIIANYWELKGFAFDNKKQYESAIKRELKPASILVGYSLERIIEVIKHLKSNADFKFTLETVHKYIDEPIKSSKGGIDIDEYYKNNKKI